MTELHVNESLVVVSSPAFQRRTTDFDVTSPDGLATFWTHIEAEGTPLVELDDHDDCIVTFVWRGAADMQQVLLIVDTLTDQYRRTDLSRCMMQHIAGTDIWHLSYRMRADLRATYHVYPVATHQPALSTGAKSREEWIDIISNTHPDPFNAKTFPSRRGKSILSVLELPNATPQPWWQAKTDTAQGTLTEHRFASAILENERSIWVYLPAGYTADHAPYPLLVLLDGQVWVSLASIQTTLDNLIAAGAVPPLIAVAIDSLDPETRGNELTCNPRFVQCLNDELLPWLHQQWTVTTDPARTIIAGQSYGGLASAFAGYHAPHRFGNVLSQSGSFWWSVDDPMSKENELLVQQFATAETRALQFYVAIGLQEWMMLTPNRHLRDVLLAKGYSLTYTEYNGGHDYICWRGDIADGLIDLTRRWQNGTNIPPSVQSPDTITVTSRSTIPPQKPKSPAPVVTESPRLVALHAAIERGDTDALATFWTHVAAAGTPLVEPVENEPTMSIVTFVWRGGSDLRDVVLLANKFTDASVFDASVLQHIPNSDVWHRSYRIRSDWRATYRIAPVQRTATSHTLDGHLARLVERAAAVGSSVPRATLERWWSAYEHGVRDPYNHHEHQGYSIAELPEAPAQPWVHPCENIPVGTLTEHLLRSDILGNERRAWVYTPAGYDAAGEPYAVLVMLDGQSWIEDHPIVPTLDALIAAGEIPPVVAILPEALGFEERVREMAGHVPFVTFLSDELLPWAATRWTISDDPQQTTIAGQSLGGLTAAFAGLFAPERFGNILSQSGSFWWANGSAFDSDSEWLTQQYARLPKRALRFYMEVGLEEWVLLPPTRHLHRVLCAKGYDVLYSEFNGGHDDACFRGSIADGLRALMS